MARFSANASDHKILRIHQKLIIQVFVKREKENLHYNGSVIHITEVTSMVL